MREMRVWERRGGFNLVGSGLLGFRPNKLKTSLNGSFPLLIISKSNMGHGDYPINDN